MSVRSDILKKLAASKNEAVEGAIEQALAVAGPDEQRELAEVLLERDRRPGWVALIRVFNRLDPEIQGRVVSRPRELFGPLAETMQDASGPARENVIAIVQKCADTRLVYLLAESLMDARTEVRELASSSLIETVRRVCNRAGAEASEQDVNPDEMQQMHRAIDFALRRFRDHRQLNVVLAALMYERQQDAPMWALFQDPYDDVSRAATSTLRSPSDPALAAALILALGSPLKSAAMAGLAAIEAPPMAEAVAAESFRLLDPVLRDGAQGISHLKLLPAMRKSIPWNTITWTAWLRLVENIGLQVQERISWLTRMLEDAAPQPQNVGWRICLLRALAETRSVEAGPLLAAAIRDPDERVARCAARFLLGPRIGEWRELAEAALPRSPHLSVRRLGATGMRGRREAVPMNPGASFQNTWADYEKMPPAVQHSNARAAAADPASAEQLRAKLQGNDPQDLTQGLKMLQALPNLIPYRNQVIVLCGHNDPRIAAMAIRLVGRLEDPRLKDLLEAATHHLDPRVRANAIESMEELHIVDKSQQVMAMLNSRFNRERANAIKAIGQFNFTTARECLERMLSDPNPLHRLSALWVVGEFDILAIMREVALMARRDPNLRVRKRAAEMVETLSGNIPTPL